MKFPWRCLLVVAALMAGLLLAVACEEEEEESGPTATPTPAASPTAEGTQVATPTAPPPTEVVSPTPEAPPPTEEPPSPTPEVAEEPPQPTPTEIPPEPTEEPPPPLPTSVPSSQAINYVGKETCVEVARADCSYRPDVSGQPTFCNDAPYPAHSFTALICGNNRDNWSTPPEQLYDGACLNVCGLVTSYRGTPQIELAGPSQASFCQ